MTGLTPWEATAPCTGPKDLDGAGGVIRAGGEAVSLATFLAATLRIVPSQCFLHQFSPIHAPSWRRALSPTSSKHLAPVHGTVASQGVNPVIRVDPKLPLSVGPARAAVARCRWGRPERLSRDSVRPEHGLRLMGAGLGVGTLSPAHPLESRKTQMVLMMRGKGLGAKLGVWIGEHWWRKH